ncbi:hypothetical protein QQP08_021019 [Theobroma cacao]|nr:hypothetical protein QQP08_021019 [Theobroma cacao]
MDMILWIPMETFPSNGTALHGILVHMITERADNLPQPAASPCLSFIMRQSFPAPYATGAAKHKQIVSGAKPSLLQQLRDKQQRLPPVLRCSSHMCPIQVHWHVNHIQNYSNGNLVVFHPSLTCIFSFNYNPLNYDGDIAMILGFFGGFSIITTSCCNQVRNGMCRLNCYCKKIQEFSPLGRMDFPKKDLF